MSTGGLSTVLLVLQTVEHCSANNAIEDSIMADRDSYFLGFPT